MSNFNTHTPLDYISVPVNFLEENAEVSNKDIGALLRLAYYQYRHPADGNRLRGAGGWAAIKWAVNCAGLKAADVKREVTGLWHWEEDTLIIDCLQEGFHKALDKRNTLSKNAQKRWSGSDEKNATAMQLHSNSIASNKYKDEETSISTSERVSTSISHSSENKNEYTSSGRDETEEREFIEQSVEEEKYKQSVEVSSKQVTTGEDEKNHALAVSKTEAFKRWAESNHNVRAVDSLRTTVDGVTRLIELVQDYESPSANRPDDDIGF